MHIDPTGVSFPLLKRISRCLKRHRVMLLNPQVPNGMACCADGGKQLRFAVKQSLPPLRVAGTHRQHAVAQPQRPAMTGKGIASQLRPVLPECSQRSFSPPDALQSFQASADRLDGCRFGRNEQFPHPEAASL